MKDDTTILDSTLNAAAAVLQQRATTLPQLGLNHLPITSPRSYYRSKLLTFNNGINSLITTAAPLLTIAAALRDRTYAFNTIELYQELTHELKAFETQAQNCHYRSEQILVARYVLCATIDEIITHTMWGKQTWHYHKLLAAFHNEETSEDRFFVILNRLSADIAQHIDLLELIYCCLNLGFEGKYRELENGSVKLAEIIDQLYQNIRWQRGEITKELLIAEKNSQAKIITTTDSMPIWLLIILTLMIISTLYIVFNFTLGSNTNALFQQFNQFLQSYD
jgi:type VI secretion system protein ImpK